MTIYYKAARWNGQEIDDGPGAVAMKIKVRCDHRVFTRNINLGLEIGLDPRFRYCRARCGYVVGPQEPEVKA